MITLSVVVPVRDGERFIADALTSLSRNARPGFEFIVVNDGSADATGDIIDDFAGDLPGLTVLRNPAPVGLADARNAGLSAATGRYVTFMDGDDWLAPGYLERLVAAIDGLGCWGSPRSSCATGSRRTATRCPSSTPPGPCAGY
ncbi:glycosyltransferase family 2 protein, partial [Nonomuraea fuscirosea]|uniref:glycosyltransferase family 2 protein n=1 Tax=Nonomuraea fuscirosea TaxID=1291556 RepID=UPI003446FDEB